MKVRLTGSAKDFKNLDVETLDKTKFESFRKPQTGGNPRYKKGGDKYDPTKGEQLLMYLDINMRTLKKMFEVVRKSASKSKSPKAKTVKKRIVSPVKKNQSDIQ